MSDPPIHFITLAAAVFLPPPTIPKTGWAFLTATILRDREDPHVARRLVVSSGHRVGAHLHIANVALTQTFWDTRGIASRSF